MVFIFETVLSLTPVSSAAISLGFLWGARARARALFVLRGNFPQSTFVLCIGCPSSPPSDGYSHR